VRSANDERWLCRRSGRPAAARRRTESVSLYPEMQTRSGSSAEHGLGIEAQARDARWVNAEAVRGRRIVGVDRHADDALDGDEHGEVLLAREVAREDPHGRARQHVRDARRDRRVWRGISRPGAHEAAVGEARAPYDGGAHAARQRGRADERDGGGPRP
jgi:hypothetical protein